MKTLILTLLFCLCGFSVLADGPQVPVVPPIHIPQWQCHYEVNGHGELEKVCGWY